MANDSRSTVRSSQTPTVAAAEHVTGDAVGGLLTFDVSGSRGRITNAIVICLTPTDVDYDLVLFNQTMTPTADDAAFDPSDADLLNLIGVMQATILVNFADNGVFIMNPATSVPISYDNHTGQVFGQLVARGTVTPAANGVTIVITSE